jgi:hypothetical protein
MQMIYIDRIFPFARRLLRGASGVTRNDIKSYNPFIQEHS